MGVFVGGDGLEATFEEFAFVDDEGALFEGRGDELTDLLPAEFGHNTSESESSSDISGEGSDVGPSRDTRSKRDHGELTVRDFEIMNHDFTSGELYRLTRPGDLVGTASLDADSTVEWGNLEDFADEMRLDRILESCLHEDRAGFEGLWVDVFCRGSEIERVTGSGEVHIKTIYLVEFIEVWEELGCAIGCDDEESSCEWIERPGMTDGPGIEGLP